MLRWWLHQINLENTIIVAFALCLSVLTFYGLTIFNPTEFDGGKILTNLLTVNGVFSAILISYLLSRVSWTQERKLELHNDAVFHSQKITEFRRILHLLTRYYNVWSNQKATKDLFDHGKYKHLDFYEYKMFLTPVKESNTSRLVDALFKEPDFSEGMSATYLAMATMVENRKIPDYVYQEELHNDFQNNEIYDIFFVKRWLECNLTDTIWYWMNRQPGWIRYGALGKEQQTILEAACRINGKFQGHKLDDKLIEELANEIGNHHLRQLFRLLKRLKKGIEGINLLITILVLMSVFFGVLIPFILLMINPCWTWFNFVVSIVASANVGLMAFFLSKFPFIINRELKWA